MAQDQDEKKPRFQIIDNRLLSEDERKGTAPAIEIAGQPQPVEAPRLEIIGGHAPASGAFASPDHSAQPGSIGESTLREEPGQAVSAPSASGDASDATETVPGDSDAEPQLSEAEMEQLQNEVEAEQFAQLEAEVGRPLTEQEKTQVRQMMAQQAQSMSRLDVSPLLLQTIQELPRYAAVHLGLIANPYTGLIASNAAEARLAIEAFAALNAVLKTKLEGRAAQELARVEADLKANFQRITGQTISVPTASPFGAGTPFGGPRIIR